MVLSVVVIAVFIVTEKDDGNENAVRGTHNNIQDSKTTQAQKGKAREKEGKGEKIIQQTHPTDATHPPTSAEHCK